jgi:hypothetical protein
MGTSEEKTADIFRTQFSKSHRTVAEAVGKKAPDEVPIPGSCRRSDTAFLCEINLIPVLDYPQRRFVQFALWSSYETLVSEMVEESKEGAYIATATMVPGVGLSKKTIGNIF